MADGRFVWQDVVGLQASSFISRFLVKKSTASFIE